MTNYVISALANQDHIRILACDVTHIMQELSAMHDLWPTAAAALGRTIATATLMASTLKNDNESLAIVIKGDGPLGALRIEANHQVALRAYVDNPHVNLINEQTHKLDVGKAIGKGHLTVIRTNELKRDYASTIDLVTSEIGDDFAQYFVQSEQIPSALSVGVLCNSDGSIASAGAILFQMMPGHDELDIQMTEHIVSGLKPISQIIQEGQKLDEVIGYLYDDVKIVGQKEVHLHCHCSLEKMLQALITLPKDDLNALIMDEQPISMRCHYCNNEYTIDKDVLKQWIEHANS